MMYRFVQISESGKSDIRNDDVNANVDANVNAPKGKQTLKDFVLSIVDNPNSCNNLLFNCQASIRKNKPGSEIVRVTSNQNDYVYFDLYLIKFGGPDYTYVYLESSAHDQNFVFRCEAEIREIRGTNQGLLINKLTIEEFHREFVENSREARQSAFLEENNNTQFGARIDSLFNITTTWSPDDVNVVVNYAGVKMDNNDLVVYSKDNADNVRKAIYITGVVDFVGMHSVTLLELDTLGSGASEYGEQSLIIYRSEDARSVNVTTTHTSGLYSIPNNRVIFSIDCIRGELYFNGVHMTEFCDKKLPSENNKHDPRHQYSQRNRYPGRFYSSNNTRTSRTSRTSKTSRTYSRDTASKRKKVTSSKNNSRRREKAENGRSLKKYKSERYRRR